MLISKLRLDPMDTRVLTAPRRPFFNVEEIGVGEYDAVNRAPEVICDFVETEGEPRVMAFESHGDSPVHGPRHTEVWEFEDVLHRFSANDATFLHHMKRKIRTYVDKIEKRKRDGFEHEDLFKDDNHPKNVIGHDPVNDGHCHWIYSRAQCAFPVHCEYRYSFGDINLSQSCRLKRRGTGEEEKAWTPAAQCRADIHKKHEQSHLNISQCKVEQETPFAT